MTLKTVPFKVAWTLIAAAVTVAAISEWAVLKAEPPAITLTRAKCMTCHPDAKKFDILLKQKMGDSSIKTGALNSASRAYYHAVTPQYPPGAYAESIFAESFAVPTHLPFQHLVSVSF